MAGVIQLRIIDTETNGDCPSAPASATTGRVLPVGPDGKTFDFAGCAVA